MNVNRPPAGPPPESLPPNDTEAEEQVLGALLVDDLAIAEIAGLLRPEDFFLGTHRAAFEAMLALYGRGQPTDISLVRAELEQRDALEEIGGAGTLVGWINAVPTAVNLLHYASLVADRALRRRLIRAAGQIGNLAYETPTAAEAAHRALDALAGAAAGGEVRAWRTLGEGAAEVWRRVEAATEARQAGEAVVQGLPTGLRDLDRYGGLRPGELILLAARPSMGKSSLAVQIAATVAAAGKRVLIFSAEMPGEEVAGRALWQQTRLDSALAYKGRLESADLARLADAVGAAQGLPVRIDDTPSLPVAALVARARAARREGVDLVVVDYLQLLKGAPRRDGNRVAEVTEISAALKGLARDLDCPVLALSQLNREAEHRAGSEPHLSDLRDSGSLEQDADQVWLLWREGLDVKTATLKVAKNRSGPTGAFELWFDTTTTRFDLLETRFGG